MTYKYETRKTFNFHKSGRSSDYISVPFVRNCLSECQYCYVHRHFLKSRTLLIANNIPTILDKLDEFSKSLGTKKPNQTDSKYWTFDIGCQSDMSIDANYLDWIYIFNYFKNSNINKATFATKTINTNLLKFNPDKKVRIRMSLTPNYGIEKKTSPLNRRIDFINRFYDSGYEVHLNLSPIIIEKNIDSNYSKLFDKIKRKVRPDVYSELKLECIFLTHSEQLHNYNVSIGLDESLLWTPDKQEIKLSEIPNEENVRYNFELKSKAINWFKNKVKNELNLEIRYIF